ncbi:unnamed protein product [Symbiodinium sp. CCMP2456]|nr:unnamed protein product [Symbiodinium sp. CCMP2456]
MLTDGQPELFTARVGVRGVFRDDIAAQLQTQEHFLTLRSSVPRIADVYPRGHLGSGVVVATERLSRVPYPPARTPEQRTIVMLDCRFILKGFDWLLVLNGRCAVQSLVDRFRPQCPDGYIVAVTGASIETIDDRPFFVVVDGTLLTVDFVEDALGDDVPTDPLPGRNNVTDEGTDDDDAPPDNEFLPEELCQPSTSVDTGGTRDRSRSPVPGRPVQGLPELLNAALYLLAMLAVNGEDSRLRMWLAASLHDALPESQQSSTSVFLPSVPRGHSLLAAFPRTGEGILEILHLLPSAWCSHILRMARQLRFPELAGLLVADFSFGPMQALRAVGYGHPPCVEQPITIDTDSAVGVDGVFVVLAVEYSPEVLLLSISVPQTVEDAVELVQTCRAEAGRASFPILAPLDPQPDPRRAFLIAVPEWLESRVIIGLHVVGPRQEVFSVAAPTVVDRHRLLCLAGLPADSGLDVFVGSRAEPLDPGEDVAIYHGVCVSFVSGGHRPFHCAFAEMLQSHLPWSTEPLSGNSDTDLVFCVVGDSAYYPFTLRPARATRYADDLASLLQLPRAQVRITPAVPAITDACVAGAGCNNVVAVEESFGGGMLNKVVGLLDCRPVLGGWHVLHADQGWLQLGPIRHGLDQSTPPGKKAVISDCCQHWTWFWLRMARMTILEGRRMVILLTLAVPARAPTWVLMWPRFLQSLLQAAMISLPDIPTRRRVGFLTHCASLYLWLMIVIRACGMLGFLCTPVFQAPAISPLSSCHRASRYAVASAALLSLLPSGQYGAHAHGLYASCCWGTPLLLVEDSLA